MFKTDHRQQNREGISYKQLLWRISLYSLLICLLASCRFGGSSSPTPTPYILPADLNSPQFNSTGITYTVQRGDVLQTLSFEGSVESASVKELFFENDGRVSKVFVKSGDLVATGTLIAQLEITELELQRDIAQLTLEATQNRVDLFNQFQQNDLDRAQQYYEIAKLRLEQVRQNSSADPYEIQIRERELSLAQLNVSRVESGTPYDVNYGYYSEDFRIAVSRARLDLQHTERLLARSQIIAPMGGTVRLHDDLIEGRLVKSYTPLALLIDQSTSVIKSNLAKTDLEFLYEGMKVEIRSKLRPTEKIDGDITALPQPFGSGIGSLVTISPQITSTNSSLRQGSTQQILVELARSGNALWLPPEAIKAIGSGTFVFIRNGTEIRQQAVTIGLKNEKQMEILSGLQEGDIVEVQAD